MPAGKRQQSSTVLYTLIIFVAFFIVSTVFAVIFYTKSEDYKANVMSLENQISDIATVSERSKISTLVGSKTSGSYMNTMIGFPAFFASAAAAAPSFTHPILFQACPAFSAASTCSRRWE